MGDVLPSSTVPACSLVGIDLFSHHLVIMFDVIWYKNLIKYSWLKHGLKQNRKVYYLFMDVLNRFFTNNIRKWQMITRNLNNDLSLPYCTSAGAVTKETNNLTKETNNLTKENKQSCKITFQMLFQRKCDRWQNKTISSFCISIYLLSIKMFGLH